jgi:ketosteroid isomerase-like protein
MTGQLSVVECFIESGRFRRMMEQPDPEQVTSLVEQYHACWSDADVQGMMECCHEDFSLFLNAAGPGGGPIRLFGKPDVSAFLLPIAEVAESKTVPLRLSYRDGVMRTQVDATVRHRATGHTLRCTYRQVIQFYGPKLIASEEFHDAAMMRAFWEMVASDTAFRGQGPT